MAKTKPRKSRQLEMLPRARISQTRVIQFALTYGIPPLNAAKLCKAAALLEDAGFTITK